MQLSPSLPIIPGLHVLVLEWGENHKWWSEDETLISNREKCMKRRRVTARAFLSARLGMLAESSQVGRATVSGSSPQAGCAFPLS